MGMPLASARSFADLLRDLIMLSLKTMADEKEAKGFEAGIGFRLGEERFVSRMRKGRFKVARGEPTDTDFTFTGGP